MHAYMHAYMHACVPLAPPCGWWRGRMEIACIHACIYACIYACVYACIYAICMHSAQPGQTIPCPGGDGTPGDRRPIIYRKTPDQPPQRPLCYFLHTSGDRTITNEGRLSYNHAFNTLLHMSNTRYTPARACCGPDAQPPMSLTKPTFSRIPRCTQNIFIPGPVRIL